MVRRDTLAALTTSLALAGCGASTAQAPSEVLADRSAARARSTPIAGGQGPKTGNVRTSDLNHDGVPEVLRYYETIDDPERPGQKKTVLIRQDIDMTWDGRVDIWRYFDVDGKTEKEEWDTDFDGNIDETRFFQRGVIVRSERDRNNDGRADVLRFYKDGKLERKESDTNEDGQVDRWEYYTGQTLERIGIDKDYDGKVDSWSKKK